jgi:hypothetical protein
MTAASDAAFALFGRGHRARGGLLDLAEDLAHLRRGLLRLIGRAP